MITEGDAGIRLRHPHLHTKSICRKSGVTSSNTTAVAAWIERDII